MILCYFLEGNEISIQILLSKLVSFGDCSGLKMSLQKSSIYATGLSCIDLEKFPFRYLGFPEAAFKLTIAQFHPFMNRISDYINSWAGMALSYAGRCKLIRLVL